MFVPDVVLLKPIRKNSTRSPAHTLLFMLILPVADAIEPVGKLSGRQGRRCTVWPIFAVLTLARLLVASSEFEPERQRLDRLEPVLF